MMKIRTYLLIMGMLFVTQPAAADDIVHFMFSQVSEGAGKESGRCVDAGIGKFKAFLASRKFSLTNQTANMMHFANGKYSVIVVASAKDCLAGCGNMPGKNDCSKIYDWSVVEKIAGTKPDPKDGVVTASVENRTTNSQPIPAKAEPKKSSCEDYSAEGVSPGELKLERNGALVRAAVGSCSVVGPIFDCSMFKNVGGGAYAWESVTVRIDADREVLRQLIRTGDSPMIVEGAFSLEKGFHPTIFLESPVFC